MSCTTILVGKKASYDGSTMIARNDDNPTGLFADKKLAIVKPDSKEKVYKSKISECEVALPEGGLSYTCMPSVDLSAGIWAASGVNELNVGMTATETITSNPRVLGADPLVRKIKATETTPLIPGGLGEEDLVVLVLPYIKSAKEGVIRLGSLLEQYGTYEENGIAFNDSDSIWWLETIGGHNWIAKRVNDEEYVVMPNQFGLDNFNFEDAYGEQKNCMCSKGLKDLVINNHLCLNFEGEAFNPRLAFGSNSDSDHVYNTPRAWFMERYLNPRSFIWDGTDADFTPESDDIPWSLVPERKITIEDVKYLLSSYYQGTPYNPYAKGDSPLKGKYRPIGISRTSFMSILQIRPYMPKEFQAIEWICYGSNAFNAIIPFYTNTKFVPDYLGNTTEKIDLNNFYWASRLIGLLADKNYGTSIIHVERYQDAVLNNGHRLLNEFDKKLKDSKNHANIIKEANEAIADMALNETNKVVAKLFYDASMHMKNGFNRSDN